MNRKFTKQDYIYSNTNLTKQYIGNGNGACAKAKWTSHTNITKKML